MNLSSLALLALALQVGSAPASAGGTGPLDPRAHLAHLTLPSLPAPPPGARAARCLAERASGQAALRSERWARAAQHFERAIAIFPGSVEDLLGLARARASAEEPGAALEALREASARGSLNAAEATTDPYLAPLVGRADFQAWLLSLPASRERIAASHRRAPLARSRDEVLMHSAQVESLLGQHAELLGRVLAQDAVAGLARWRSASLLGLAASEADAAGSQPDAAGSQPDAAESQADAAESEADSAESEALRRDALRALIDDARVPLVLALAPDVMELSQGQRQAPSEHWIEAWHALAEARWIATVLDSPGGAKEEATRRYRRDLLELAAVAVDDPALEPVLKQLIPETIDDLTLASALGRRLLGLTRDVEVARQGLQRVAPSVILAMEGLPAFSAVTTDGRQISNATLPGRLTVLHFWATWCAPCKPGLPALRGLHERFGSAGLDVIGVASETEETDETDKMAARRAFERWCAENGVTWPQVLDVGPEGSTLSQSLGFRRIPHLILIDARGRLAAAARAAEDLEQSVTRLLADGADELRSDPRGPS